HTTRMQQTVVSAVVPATIQRSYFGRRRDHSGRLYYSFSFPELVIVFPIVQRLLHCYLSHISRVSNGRATSHGLNCTSIAESLNTRNCDLWISDRDHMGLRCDKTVRLS